MTIEEFVDHVNKGSNGIEIKMKMGSNLFVVFGEDKIIIKKEFVNILRPLKISCAICYDFIEKIEYF